MYNIYFIYQCFFFICFYIKNLCDKSKLEIFFEENKTDDSYLSYNKTVPIQSNDIFSANNQWGCKWNASDVDYSFDNKLKYTFNSPWNYPHVWLDVVARKYADLKFKLVTIYEDPTDSPTKVVYIDGKPTYYIKKWKKVNKL